MLVCVAMGRKELISVTEAARRLGVSKAWVVRLCQQGRIPGAQKIGGVWVIPVGAKIKPAVPRKSPGRPLRTREIP